MQLRMQAVVQVQLLYGLLGLALGGKSESFPAVYTLLCSFYSSFTAVFAPDGGF